VSANIETVKSGQAPDYRAIARFRRWHLSALGHLFLQALALCQAAGMVRLGRVALDGTKLRAVHPEFFIATGRRSHDEPAPAPPRGRIPKDLPGGSGLGRRGVTYRRNSVPISRFGNVTGGGRPMGPTPGGSPRFAMRLPASSGSCWA
jgi:hypothetical protein